MSEQSAEKDVLVPVLAAHYPHLFRCSCGTEIRTRSLPDQGERETAWASHLADVLRSIPPGSSTHESAESGEVSARAPHEGEDCTAAGFSGEGRCLEPAAQGSLCVEHARRRGAG